MEWNQLRNSPRIWLENETRRIGNLGIPDDIFNHMSKSPLIYLDVPQEERIKLLLKEYGNMPTDNLERGIRSVGKRLGNQKMQESLVALHDNRRGDLCKLLLDCYYDKIYTKTIEKEANRIHLLSCPSTDSEQNSEKLLQQIDRLCL